MQSLLEAEDKARHQWKATSSTEEGAVEPDPTLGVECAKSIQEAIDWTSGRLGVFELSQLELLIQRTMQPMQSESRDVRTICSSRRSAVGCACFQPLYEQYAERSI